MIRAANIRNLVTALASAAVLACLFATPALAAPAFEVTLERDSATFPTVSRSDERVDYTVKVKNAGTTPTAGTVELELELPGGEESYVFSTQGTGWSCTTTPASGAQHAEAICTRADALNAGAEYPSLKAVMAMGADVPDVALAKATVSGGGTPAPASDSLAFVVGPPIPFGLAKFTAALCGEPPRTEPGTDTCSELANSDNYTQAGGHPLLGLSETAVNQKRALVPEPGSAGPLTPVDYLRQIVVEVPPGVVGNALALPELCPTVEDVRSANCPPGSVIGGIEILLTGFPSPVKVPIYAIEPEFGTPAQFAFADPAANLYTFSPRLRPDDGYAIDFELAPAPKVGFQEATVTLCDFGGNKSGSSFTGCKTKDEVGANPKPLFTNPTRCGVELVTRARLNSWEDPTFISAPPFKNAKITGCGAVPFEPQMSFDPSSREADSPTGMDIELSMPTDGLEDSSGISQSNLRQATIAFPRGMAVNPSAGQGLAACSAAQIKLGTNDPIECPESSRIGSVEIQTPLIEDTLEGSVYVARQGEVQGSLVGFYLVFDSPENGILIKMPAKVTPDPGTGQLTATVSESPQAPFSAVRMHFPAGPRATLLTPPTCGTYEIKATLVPWSGGKSVPQTSSFKVDRGPGGGPCPSDALAPKLRAGTSNPTAAQTGAFTLQLSRDDGSQRFKALDIDMPPGLSAYLKGVPYCPDAVLDAISPALGTGQAQIDNPSCPAASLVGSAIAGAGAGPDPFYARDGRAYLAGPYRGAPLSIAVVAPAVAGPLDLGNVVVRNAVFLDPETAQASIVSDPIPTILHGLLLDIRDIQVAIDRPNFILNPTNCEPASVAAEVSGEGGAKASASDRFQVGGCESLAFKPKLSIRLFGGTKRGGHPALEGVLEAAPGEANISGASVAIPRSEFLDQAHIRTICTRVQFAAKACPKGSIYGHATATTPLLDYPVSGPVYLRSSDHKLPDLVVALRGPDHQPIEAVVVGRVDSIKGQIRTTFESAPDVPLTKFVLNMQGGKKGLLINSRGICAQTNRATVRLEGHNGMSAESRPPVKSNKCGRKPRGKRAG
ncbi:MAG TPA: hypothetical protein VFM94_00910 [Solirubrobacterales bacterium]|nr:hypothetical protein [Solirubrobacterales bacterium]